MSLIHINRDRQPLGQFPVSDVSEGLRSGRFLPTDLAWREGMDSWVKLSDLPDLQKEIPPPLAGELASSDPMAIHEPAVPLPEPAWERRAELGFVDAAVESVKQVLTRPVETFSGMPRAGGFAGPLWFNILLSWIGGGAALGYQAVWAMVNPGEMEKQLQGLSMGVFWIAMIGVFLFLPVLILISAFLGAGIMHLSLWVLGGAKHSFETTFRVLCYSNGATALLQLVPLCGGAAYFVWYLVATVIGLVKAHETEPWRVVIAVLLPVLLCCGILIAIFTVAGAAGFATLQQAME